MPQEQKVEMDVSVENIAHDMMGDIVANVREKTGLFIAKVEFAWEDDKDGNVVLIGTNMETFVQRKQVRG